MSDFEQLRLGQMDVWFCIPQKIVAADLEDYCEGLLTGEELEHYRRLKADHRLEYLVSHALLRTTLSRYLPGEPGDWQFRRNEFGKPELVADIAGAEQLRFNLSNTNGLVLCAVSGGADLGVDVEFHANSQGLLEVADHYFSELELAGLQGLSEAEQEQAFFRYWTLKEAYIKAKGEGLSIPLDSFSFVLGASDTVHFIPPPGDAQTDWSFQLYYPGEEYTAAVAVQAPIQRARLFESWFTGYRQLEQAGMLFSD